MRVTAILNLKGGVAKTTTTVNMAAILAADYHKRVLVVDADNQANTTEFFGGDPAKPGLADLLRGKTSDDRPLELQNTRQEGVTLISADDSLMDLDLSKVEEGEVNSQCLVQLRRYLEARQNTDDDVLRYIIGVPYDYCLIDCPPAFNAACAAALVAADDVVIPIKLDAFSLRGMANLMRQIQNMRKINPALKLAGLLPTMVYRNDNVREARATLEASGLPVFSPIRRTAKVDDMTFAQEPLIKSSPKSAACVDYRRFVKAYVEVGSGPSRAPAPTERNGGEQNG